VELCACSIVYYDCQCNCMCVFRSFYSLSVELSACIVIYNNCRWNVVRVY
jgi:hypothetical protein